MKQLKLIVMLGLIGLSSQIYAQILEISNKASTSFAVPFNKCQQGVVQFTPAPPIAANQTTKATFPGANPVCSFLLQSDLGNVAIGYNSEQGVSINGCRPYSASLLKCTFDSANSILTISQ